ncbi:potassium transporter Kef [Natronococcus sp. JC468]|uniref:cation:proton antiporter n=1 Tax=Natronococcus sp. JC468 TaxID=1961921 RepID=UPI00143A789D|nr:cation:proton antiporter [Natronococcus sp. JC468]NKE37973.1 potassium transporter Kef [Natronococcus sp. JC468]
MATEIAFAADFAIIIVVATIVGFIARQTGQPTIIAYILTGLILGPVFLDLVTEEGLVELMAELGLGFLLFLLGIKMRFDDVRNILRPIVNIAVWQTVLQTALAFAVAYLLGFGLVETIVIALATVFGATPIIVKILSDKDEITELPGKIDVGVLIVQDIYLVIVLALLSAESLGNPTEIATTIVTILFMMSFIAIFSIASSRYILPQLFRRIADNKDIFFIIGIAWAFFFIAISEQFNLSLEVGAFLAGISLAQLPYSKELEERVSPVTDFFILVFFASIGLRLAADDLLTYWVEAVIASLVLMIGNFWIMFYLIDRENFSVETSFLGSVNMIQVSEFSLVVGAIGVAQGFIDTAILGYLSLMAILTMSISTYIINYNKQIYQRVEPWFSRFDSEEKGDVELEEYRDHAVVIGYDKITERALPTLKEQFGQVVLIDRKTAHVEKLKNHSEYDVIYGDFKHGEIRKAAQLKQAAFVLSSTVQPEINERLLTEVSSDTTVFVEAEYIEDARRLYEAGADYVIMSTHMMADQMIGYLDQYFDDQQDFVQAISDDVRQINQEAVEHPSETSFDANADIRGDLDG